MGGGIVPELCDLWVTIEGGLDHASLYPSPPTVHDAHLVEPGGCGRAHIFRDYRTDVAWRESVEVDFRFDGNVDRITHHVEMQECTNAFCIDPARSANIAYGRRLLVSFSVD